MGYVNNDVATRQAIDEDGYLHTGDLGSMDANGLVTIHDRMKELIKVPPPPSYQPVFSSAKAKCLFYFSGQRSWRRSS